MMRSIIAKWKFVGSLVVLLLCTNVAGWHDLNKIENTRCQNVGTPAKTTKKQENTWRGLMPLHSTREALERLLGPPKDSVGTTFIYETQAEKVHVWYSDGACKTSPLGQWDVPIGTILQIRVYPKAIILLRDLQLDTNKYRRFPDPNISNWVLYKSENDGVMVQTSVENGCEQVEIITYEPKKEDGQLRCPITHAGKND